MSLKIGDTVMVRPDRGKPRFGWGSVERGELGVFRGKGSGPFVEKGEIMVDFPSQADWRGMPSDIMKVSGLKGIPGETNMKTKAGTSWSFASISMLDIDYNEISKELSKANPMAIISAEGKDDSSYGVMIHEFLTTKAEVCSLPRPSGKTISVRNCIVVKITKEDFSEWIAWAKVVKGAAWPKKFKRKAKVKVTLVHI